MTAEGRDEKGRWVEEAEEKVREEEVERQRGRGSKVVKTGWRGRRGEGEAGETGKSKGEKAEKEKGEADRGVGVSSVVHNPGIPQNPL